MLPFFPFIELKLGIPVWYNRALWMVYEALSEGGDRKASRTNPKATTRPKSLRMKERPVHLLHFFASWHSLSQQQLLLSPQKVYHKGLNSHSLAQVRSQGARGQVRAALDGYITVCTLYIYSVCLHIHTEVHTSVQAYRHTYIQTYTHAYMDTCMHSYITLHHIT